jgi:ribosomal protein L40E
MKKLIKCECDNTHEQNQTVCRFCWNKGIRWKKKNKVEKVIERAIERAKKGLAIYPFDVRTADIVKENPEDAMSEVIADFMQLAETEGIEWKEIMKWAKVFVKSDKKP